MFVARPPSPQMQTERLNLEVPTLAHWKDWAEIRRQSRTFLAPWEPSWGVDHLSKAAFRRRLHAYRNDKTVRPFFIIRRADDQLLGGVTLNNIRYGVVQSASLGYWLGEPFAGQGYMTEALSRVMDYAFDEMKLHRLEAACMPANKASRRLLERLGFQEEGFFRGYLKINGVWEDHVIYSLLSPRSG